MPTTPEPTAATDSPTTVTPQATDHEGESAVMATLSTNVIIGIVAGVVILILHVLLITALVLIIVR